MEGQTDDCSAGMHQILLGIRGRRKRVRVDHEAEWSFGPSGRMKMVSLARCSRPEQRECSCVPVLTRFLSHLLRVAPPNNSDSRRNNVSRQRQVGAHCGTLQSNVPFEVQLGNIGIDLAFDFVSVALFDVPMFSVGMHRVKQSMRSRRCY